MRSPVAMSNGCAPVLASYSAITSLTSSMLAVAGSYSKSVVSPQDENVRILAFMVGLLLTLIFSALGKQAAGLDSLRVISHRFRKFSRRSSTIQTNHSTRLTAIQQTHPSSIPLH